MSLIEYKAVYKGREFVKVVSSKSYYYYLIKNGFYSFSNLTVFGLDKDLL